MVMAQVTCSSNSPVLIFVVVVCWVGGIIDCMIVRECVCVCVSYPPPLSLSSNQI